MTSLSSLRLLAGKADPEYPSMLAMELDGDILKAPGACKDTKRFIAALSPAFVLKMVAVCEAGEAYMSAIGGTRIATGNDLIKALQQLSSASEGAAWAAKEVDGTR